MENNTESYLTGRRDAFAEALSLVAKHDPRTGHEVSPYYWGNTLRSSLVEAETNAEKALKALQHWQSNEGNPPNPSPQQ